jgi:hypothetical protein
MPDRRKVLSLVLLILVAFRVRCFPLLQTVHTLVIMVRQTASIHYALRLHGTNRMRVLVLQGFHAHRKVRDENANTLLFDTATSFRKPCRDYDDVILKGSTSRPSSVPTTTWLRCSLRRNHDVTDFGWILWTREKQFDFSLISKHKLAMIPRILDRPIRNSRERSRWNPIKIVWSASPTSDYELGRRHLEGNVFTQVLSNNRKYIPILRDQQTRNCSCHTESPQMK